MSEREDVGTYLSTYPLSDDTPGKFFAAFERARTAADMSSERMRAMLGLVVITYLMDDFQPTEIPGGMEKFFADIRERIDALLLAPETPDA
jgi:hypothetical protein